MINISIVLYQNKTIEVFSLVELLTKSKTVFQIFLIDNSPTPTQEYENLPVKYIFTSKNLGYGAAHNIAIRQTIKQNIPYHLVINPDISFEPQILEEIEKYLCDNLDIGQLMPKVFYPNKEIQYLCKLIPNPFDLIFRRFLPKKWVVKRIERFELRSTGYNKIMNVPYLSGCFMFLRTKAIEDVGLFDERFFMYPEDIDLTRRIHVKYRTVFYPNVSIIHHHAQSSYLNLKMLSIHTVNMIKYFNKWGWIFDKERKYINNKILIQIRNFQIK